MARKNRESSTPDEVRKERRGLLYGEKYHYKYAKHRRTEPEGAKPPEKALPEPELLRRRTEEMLDGQEIPLTYFPTRTSNPADPRTAAMGYHAKSKTLRIEWGDAGRGYYFYNVTWADWIRMRQTRSPGKLLNAGFDQTHPYGPY
jgi:hypothetical protein